MTHDERHGPGPNCEYPKCLTPRDPQFVKVGVVKWNSRHRLMG